MSSAPYHDGDGIEKLQLRRFSDLFSKNLRAGLYGESRKLLGDAHSWIAPEAGICNGKIGKTTLPDIPRVSSKNSIVNMTARGGPATAPLNQRGYRLIERRS